jgi:eukaryotic-like serine/threonine-protein kinase
VSRRTGRPFRLPDELEREKAARGVDGRFFVWGHHAELGFACTAEVQGADPQSEPVTLHPEDESPYGIRGLSGNMRDWCANLWQHEGPRIEGDRLRLTEGSPENDDFRAVKGGAWGSAVVHSRAAGRFGSRPGVTKLSVGFRLVRTLSP